ncbi:MAG: hypothetical protein K8R53_03540, partial [Bacteroidales bacterium]|nr:hypothetical protein [Bacteroidales bacterium]
NEMMQYVTSAGVRGICPEGWYLPIDEEWKVLEGAVDTQYPVGDPVWDINGWRGFDAGGNLKESGFIHWDSPNTGATNSSGFTALPGGERDYSPISFVGLYETAVCWTSTEYGSEAWYRGITYTSAQMNRSDGSKDYGFSVRCIRDISATWSCGDSLLDNRDGQNYGTVQIGNQCWMAENLNIGARIDGINNQMDNQIIEKYCYDDIEDSCDVYGGLYQWDEMMEYTQTPGIQGICPDNWHLPTDAEWCILEQFVDPTITCNSTGWRGIDGGGKLKEAGTIHWQSPNTGATNSSGFTALPGGDSGTGGYFYNLIYSGFWWSSSESGFYAWFRRLSYNLAQVVRDDNDKINGFSVRCVKEVLASNWSCGDTLLDTRDDQKYGTVQIGDQCWMAENINVGDRIDGVNDQTNNQIMEKYCYNDIEDSCDVYGGLYQWDEMLEYLADTAVQGICPIGWYIPTDFDWKVLEGSVDSQFPVGDPEWNGTGWRGFDAGYNLKSVEGWSLGGNGSNIYGFTALPSGDRYPDGSFNNIGEHFFVWTSTEIYGTNAWYHETRYDQNGVFRGSVSKNYGLSMRCIKDPEPPTWSCGDVLNIIHTAGDVAPVNKTVDYGTVETNLTGSNKCWITQNLGADQQATSATDATEESAGWYWQFNRKQGYKHDGNIRTPNTPWITSIIENSDWESASDPCALLLGTGWRLPTYTEWNDVDLNGGWFNLDDGYNSLLKIHAAGYLTDLGILSARGTYGIYWSSSQSTNTNGWSLWITNIQECQVIGHPKVYGLTSRCLKD